MLQTKEKYLFYYKLDMYFNDLDFNDITFRSNLPEVFLEKGVLKTCSKYTGEQPCWSVISIKLQSNFIEIILRHGCSPVNLLYIFRTPFTKNVSGRLLLHFVFQFLDLNSYSQPQNYCLFFTCQIFLGKNSQRNYFFNR